MSEYTFMQIVIWFTLTLMLVAVFLAVLFTVIVTGTALYGCIAPAVIACTL